MNRPIIAIPVAEVPAGPHEPPLWAMRASYAQPVFAAGGLPIFLPPLASLADLQSLLPSIQGILLAGGADIHPSLYESAAHPQLEICDLARDKLEATLVRWAFENAIPILGICRGMQMINVVAGGTLYQDLPTDLGSAVQHRSQPAAYGQLTDHGHPFILRGTSRLQGIIGKSEVWINSMHHQGVRDIGHELTVAGTSPDGLVEALEAESATHWVVGLQGHPEAMIGSSPWVPKLFDAFVAAAHQRQD